MQTQSTLISASGPLLPLSMPAEPPTLLRVVHSTKLSTRELQTLRFVSQGLTSIEIAEHLSLSRETIETHRKNIMRKLNANNIVHAVACGLRNNIIQ